MPSRGKTSPYAGTTGKVKAGGRADSGPRFDYEAYLRSMGATRLGKNLTAELGNLDAMAKTIQGLYADLSDINVPTLRNHLMEAIINAPDKKGDRPVAYGGVIEAVADVIDKKKFQERTKRDLINSLSVRLTDNGTVIVDCTHPAAPFLEIGKNPWDGGNYIYPRRAKALRVPLEFLEATWRGNIKLAGDWKERAALRAKRQSLREAWREASFKYRSAMLVLRNDELRARKSEGKVFISEKKRESVKNYRETNVAGSAALWKEAKDDYEKKRDAYNNFAKRIDWRKKRLGTAASGPYARKYRQAQRRGYAFFERVKIVHRPFLREGIELFLRKGVAIIPNRDSMKNYVMKPSGVAGRYPIQLRIKFGGVKIEATK